MAGRWEENKHPRDNDGKFSSKEVANYEEKYANMVKVQASQERGFDVSNQKTYDVSSGKEKEAINIQLFASPGIEEQGVDELKKSKKSIQENIEEHYEKLKNVDQYCKQTKGDPAKYREGLIRRWKDEIVKKKKIIARIEEKLKDEN